MMMMMMMMWPTLSAVLPLTLYNLTTSQHHHFSPENGDSIFSETLATTEQPTSTRIQNHLHRRENIEYLKVLSRNSSGEI
jgi:hypothetical protein